MRKVRQIDSLDLARVMASQKLPSKKSRLTTILLIASILALFLALLVLSFR